MYGAQFDPSMAMGAGGGDIQSIIAALRAQLAGRGAPQPAPMAGNMGAAGINAELEGRFGPDPYGGSQDRLRAMTGGGLQAPPSATGGQMPLPPQLQAAVDSGAMDYNTAFQRAFTNRAGFRERAMAALPGQGGAQPGGPVAMPMPTAEQPRGIIGDASGLFPATPKPGLGNAIGTRPVIAPGLTAPGMPRPMPDTPARMDNAAVATPQPMPRRPVRQPLYRNIVSRRLAGGQPA